MSLHFSSFIMRRGRPLYHIKAYFVTYTTRSGDIKEYQIGKSHPLKPIRISKITDQPPPIKVSLPTKKKEEEDTKKDIDHSTKLSEAGTQTDFSFSLYHHLYDPNGFVDFNDVKNNTLYTSFDETERNILSHEQNDYHRNVDHGFGNLLSIKDKKIDSDYFDNIGDGISYLFRSSQDLENDQFQSHDEEYESNFETFCQISVD